MKRSPLKRKTPPKTKKPFVPKGATSIERMLGEGVLRRASVVSKKPRKPIAKRGKSEWSMALAAADTAFSRVVRLRAAQDTGLVECFICGDVMHWGEAQLMHVVTRKKMSVRFHLFNMPGCAWCNGKPLGDRSNYLNKLGYLFGPEAVDEFLKLSNFTVKYSAQELNAMTRSLEAEASQLQAELP